MTRVVAVCVVLAMTVLAVTVTRAAEPSRTRPIELRLDATEAPRKLLHVQLVIPAAPGPLTLCYPKWIPGEHGPTGPINDLSGLSLRAGGKPLAWQRDDVDLYAFHCTVPDGADAVEVSLDYLASSSTEGFTAAASMTSQLAILNWHQLLVYPQGRPVREQTVHASLTVPRGWKWGTALPVEAEKGTIQFQTVSLETLVDSPVLCGAHFKEIPLGPPEGPPHFLILAADSDAALEISPKLKAQYEQLVVEAGAMFGCRHYRSYRFLVALSDHIPHDAVEHHESSDNRVPERTFLDDVHRKLLPSWVLPHEFVHSWNGKYRRPEGLATTNFQQPRLHRLLWVYEGLTQYLGYLLTARSGLHTPEFARENLAQIAEWAGNQRGRTWRPLEDTTVAAPFLYLARTDWASRRRGVDFYDEGALLWLDVDTLIRANTDGKKSLDDFCRVFYGGQGGAPAVKSYSFDDVVRALDGVAAHDWKGFLEKRVRTTAATPPLDGLKRAGWKVAYTDKANELLKAREEEDKTIDLMASIGLLVKTDGTVVDVVPGKAADRAGVGPNMKLLGVNERRLTAERLHQALAATQEGREKLRLLLENLDYFQTVTLDYAGGERYPHLERETKAPDVLADILRPHGTKAKR